MASEARALAKKIAAAGTLDGPILQARARQVCIADALRR